jgi:predicted Zn-dependent protease
MKTSLLLSAALVMLLPALPDPVQAQSGGVEKPTGNTRAAKRAQAAQSNPAKAAPMFPNATRAEPDPKGDKGLLKQMNELIALQEKDGTADQQIAKADAILGDPRATPYDKSRASYLAGYAWLQKDTKNYTGALKYLEGAIAANGLDNNTHFQVMLQVAQMLASDNKPAEALKYLDRYASESKSDNPAAQNLRASIMLETGKPEDAAKSLEAVLKTKPNDKKTMMNLASIYQQSGDDAKAAAMFNKMRAAGLFTESKDYEMAYRLLANLEGKGGEAMAIIDEGLAKGVLKADYDVYAFQGRHYYEANDIPKTIDAWTKGAPLAKDGEMYLNVGKLQLDSDHFAQAKAAAEGALAKGVKKQGDIYQVLAQAEEGLGHKDAARKAMQEAAKYPETKKWAEAALRQTPAK